MRIGPAAVRSERNTPLQTAYKTGGTHEGGGTRGVVPLRGRRTYVMKLRVLGTAGLALLGPTTLRAQQDSTKADSLRVHRLSEVTITAPTIVDAVTVHTSLRIALRRITSQTPRSVADVARLIPGAHVQTNSRGETLVYLRSAGERQVSVFLDGALLNVPWDNRVDLSMLPASVIDGMTVAQGVPPIEYGANVMGGVVNLTSQPPATLGRARVTAVAGSGGRREASASYHGRSGTLFYEGEVGYAALDGWPLPDGAALAFHQPATDLRTNTDSRIANAFLRGAYFVGSSTWVGASILVVDGEKGIAPEGHLDPAVARARFWRYPEWRTVLGIVSGEGDVDERTRWKSALWVGDFRQRILSFESAAYDATDEWQDGDDLTFGARATLRRQIGMGALKVALNGLTSTHWQHDVPLLPDGSPAGPIPDELVFRQQLTSAGAEYEWYPAGSTQLNVGASLDAMFAPRTGDKPSIDPFVDYTLTLGARHELGSGWHVRTAIGRKTRFPTMRELFGEALNRFLLNPDLEPESAILGELSLGFTGTRVSGEIIPFFSVVSNTIDQRNVLVPGETRPRRQRINLDGSYVFGIQIEGAARPVESLTLDGHLTLTRPRRLTDQPGESDLLAEKPEATARLAATYETRFGMHAMVEGAYRGRAYSPDEQNDFVELPTSLVVNARVGQEFEAGRTRVEVFVRGDNLTDEVVMPQLGLPGPGRSFAAGAEMTF